MIGPFVVVARAKRGALPDNLFFSRRGPHQSRAFPIHRSSVVLIHD